MRVGVTWAAGLVAAGLVAGCSASPRAADAAPESAASAAIPEDFGFAVAIPAGAEMTALYPEHADLLARPAWYMVEPDGTLRAALGSPRMDGPVPPFVRRLSPAQRRELFTLLSSRGALTPWSRDSQGLGVPVGDAARVVSGEDGGGAIGVWWSANGRRRSFAVAPATQGTDGEPAWNTVKDAVALLERWAWISTDPASGRATQAPR